MDQNERQSDNKLTIDRDAQINVVVNAPGDGEDSIDLGRVFHNMKVKRRVFAWVLVLCLTVGVCAPLLLYQFNKPLLTVASVVTLDYEIPMAQVSGRSVPLAQYREELRERGETLPDDLEIVWVPVTDLTAPDGSELNLSVISSSSILQQALGGMELSHPITLSALARNISVEQVLTEESRQAQELASKMVEDKNAEAYNQMQEVKMRYDRKFVVRLKNGFGEEDSEILTELTDAELRTLLDRILAAFNDYLVNNPDYADRKLPDNEAAEIRTDSLDLLESLDRLREASDNLYDYCDSQRTSVKEYRSSKDGRSLNDWMEVIQTAREVSIDYLYSYVYTNSIFRKPEQMLLSYENTKRDNDRSLKEVRDKIAADVKTKTENYEKPTVIVSMQESGTVMKTQKTPDSFNDLILRLAKNYDKTVTLEMKGDDLDSKIAALKKLSGTAASKEMLDEASEELKLAMATFEDIYSRVAAHMEEVLDSAFCTTYAEHTVPQGKLDNFLVANLKKMLIGAAVGAVLACGLWFLAALAPEFRRNRKEDEIRKEAARA